MTRARLDDYCEKGILTLALVILCFGALATGAVRPLEFLIVQCLTIAAVLLWLCRVWLNSNHRILWPPVCWAVAAFVLYAIIRYRVADIEYVARQELIRIVVYAALFFVISNNLVGRDRSQILCFALIFLGMAISMYAVFRYTSRSPYVWHFIRPEVYLKRGSGTFICPNHLAGFLEMLVPLGLAYSFKGRVNHLLRVLLGYASLVMLAGIGVSMSRGGWVATGISVAILFALLLARRQYRIPAFIALAALVAAGVYFYSHSDRFQGRIENAFSTESPDTANMRFPLWHAAVQMWKDHPWWGVGPAHFDYRFPQYRPEYVQARPGHVHNDYLNALVDWGVAGAGLIIAVWVLLFAGVFKTLRFVRPQASDLGSKPGNRATLLLGASLGLAATLIHSFTDFNMYIPANATLAVTLMALLAGHGRFATEGYWVKLGFLRRTSVTLIGLLVVAYLGHQACRRTREYVWLERAARETAYTPTMISALRRAAEIEPANFETTYALGEAFRRSGWDADRGGEALITEAKAWFETGNRLNPYDAYNPMKLGMCLDWLGRHDEAAPYFAKALQCDPNNYYVLAHEGWHFYQTDDLLTARKFFARSLNLYHAWHNPIAAHYLERIDRKLKERPVPASN